MGSAAGAEMVIRFRAAPDRMKKLPDIFWSEVLPGV